MTEDKLTIKERLTVYLLLLAVRCLAPYSEAVKDIEKEIKILLKD